MINTKILTPIPIVLVMMFPIVVPTPIVLEMIFTAVPPQLTTDRSSRIFLVNQFAFAAFASNKRKLKHLYYQFDSINLKPI